MVNAARHLAFAEIIRLAETAAGTGVSEARTHLKTCAACSARHSKLSNLFALRAPAFDETVPQAATANLLNIYRRSAAQSPPTLASRLAGLLIFDDWKPEFAPNERLSFQDTRQLLYRAGKYIIDLRIEYLENERLVSGQIFPEKSAVVRIYNAERSFEANLNEHGEFVFAPIERGIYRLQIITDDESIEIGDAAFS